jgi:hypothetical protein
MHHPRIDLKHGTNRVWICADDNEIGSLELDSAGKVVDQFPHDNELVGLVRDIYVQVTISRK